mgnify:CR=1 FL=1
MATSVQRLEKAKSNFNYGRLRRLTRIPNTFRSTASTSKLVRPGSMSTQEIIQLTDGSRLKAALSRLFLTSNLSRHQLTRMIDDDLPPLH